jgi:malonyl-CoA O-methyltransferase
MIRGLFVTGTDTGVGKTVVAAALMHRWRRQVGLRYWKPVQTGIEQDDDTATVRSLGGCAEAEILDRGVRLSLPVSPHLAARLAGVTLEVEALARPALEASAAGVRWIVEGAGGVLVPLDARATMADLMTRLGLPVVIAARSGLGTINHTLLTVEALRRRALEIAGVVMVGLPDRENRAAIESHGGVAVLGELPRLEPLDARTLGAWAREELDPAGRLAELLA